MNLAISQVCTLAASFEQDIEDYAAAACGNVEIWLGKLETYLESHTLDDLRRLLADSGMAAPVASFQGALLASQGEARRAHWDHFARRLELCQQLHIGTLVVAADVVGTLDEQTIQRVRASLVEAAALAGRHGVRLALEFQAQASFINNLQTAAAVVAETASPHLGICFDVFHYYTGASKEEDLAYLSRDNLFHVQLCDLASIAREWATDADRILPGDGDFNLRPIVELLRAIDYAHCVSVEMMNTQIWNIPPRQVAEVGITALRKLFGEASMGK